MLDREDAHRPFGTDNRHPGKAVEPLLAGFRHIAEIGMRRGFVEVQGFDIFRDCADQPFAKAKPRDMHRGLIQPARCEQFERAIAQQSKSSKPRC